MRVRRGAERRRFALVAFRDLQRDLARGGGEHLATFAGMLGDGDEAAVARIEDASRRAAPELLRATSAPRFVDAFDALLRAREDLRTHAL